MIYDRNGARFYLRPIDFNRIAIMMRPIIAKNVPQSPRFALRSGESCGLATFSAKPNIRKTPPIASASSPMYLSLVGGVRLRFLRRRCGMSLEHTREYQDPKRDLNRSECPG